MQSQQIEMAEQNRGNLQDYADVLCPNIRIILAEAEKSNQEKLIKAIEKAKRVYVLGAGRSGLVAKAFAMRLVHLRKKTFVVGETITPAMRKKVDLLIAVSGSGETLTVVNVAKTARKIGGKVASVTANPESSLAKTSHIVVSFPNARTKVTSTDYESGQLLGNIPVSPLGSLFEIVATIFFEWVIYKLMERLKITEKDMRKVHNSLE